MGGRSIHSILTRHFLRRFLENDLISPEADRSHLLAVVGAALFSTTLFVTVIMSAVKYIIGSLTPGQAAVLSLDDKFFYIGLSMVVVALLAVAQWDALVVDARDAAILEPLPVRPIVVRRAKLAAVALFGAGAAALVNLAPTVVFPLLLLFQGRGTILQAVRLVATHALICLAAAAFGFLCIIALRETLSALLGQRVFARVSPWVQGALIVGLGTVLLLLPVRATRIEEALHATAIGHSPPAWFLGAYERLSGDILMKAPRTQLTNRSKRADASPTAAYRADTPIFAQFAQQATMGLAAVTALAIAAYFANARRRVASMPAPVRSPRGPRLMRVLPRLTLLRGSTARAGFHFTLGVLWRSNTHRLTLACCGAAGLAMSLVALSGLDLQDLTANSRAIPRLLVVQPFLMGMLLVGFRHAIRVPAELRANRGFQLAWRGHERQFVTGARRAALVALVLPALAAVFVLDSYLLDPWRALQHAAFGAAGAAVLLEALMLGYDKVPFTCSYVPNENMKALGPLYLLMFIVGAVSFARMESTAMSAGTSGWPLTVLAMLFAALRGYSLACHRLAPVDFDEVPASTQKLGLNA